MTIHHARVFLWILLLGVSISCARRGGPETQPGAPSEAGQETPPGVPAVVQPGEPAEPEPPDQDRAPGAEAARDEPRADQDQPPADEPAPAEPGTGDSPPVAEAAAAEAVVERPAEELSLQARDETPEVRELLLLGPTYTPHDQAPTVIWDTEAQALVSRKLLPILQNQGLSARTRALFWVLLRPDGSIADVVPQTLSENDRFDAAADEVVRQLRFTPALRGERAVPVWVIQEISLLMQ